MSVEIREIRTHSEADTERIGKELALRLRPQMTVALYGTLGSGKTVLARGIARGLGIEEPITSPTFTVAQEYECPDGKWLYHLDLYRIDEEEQAIAFGIDEYLFAPEAICLLEWPERIPNLLTEQNGLGPDHLVSISISHAGPHERVVRLPAAFANGM